MELEVHTIGLGPAASNCYICSCGKDAFIIDPGCDISHIRGYIGRNRLEPVFIFLTHGHYDHVASLDLIKGQYPSAVTYIHSDDSVIMGDPLLNGAFLFGSSITFSGTDKEYSDGDVIPFSGSSVSVIHTPGHTAGSVSILAGAYIFTGDTLFRHSIGRSDLPGGDGGELMRSLRRLMSLPDRLIVLPGHGRDTVIAHEKRVNPYLTGRYREYD